MPSSNIQQSGRTHIVMTTVITLCRGCHLQTFGKYYEFVDKYKSIVERM